MRRRLISVALVVVVTAGCSKEPVAQPTTSATPTSTSTTTTTTTEAKPNPPAKIDPKSTWKKGMTITTRGKVTDAIAQHMGTSIPGKEEAEFIVDGEKHGHTVVHWKEAPKCTGLIEVTAKVIELRGHKQRPGEHPSKVDETYVEHQLDVESARCVE